MFRNKCQEYYEMEGVYYCNTKSYLSISTSSILKGVSKQRTVSLGYQFSKILRSVRKQLIVRDGFLYNF